MATAVGTAPQPRARDAESGLSVEELRAAMQRHLRDNGALRDMKAQLRTRIVTELMQHKAPPAPRKDDDDGPAAAEMTLEAFERQRMGLTPEHADGGAADLTSLWSAHIADALIENHLRRTNRPMSLSVFASEAEVPPLSDTGIPSADEGYLRQLLLSLQEEDPSLSPRHAAEAAEADLRHPSLKSVLQRLVEFHLLHSKSEAAQRLRAEFAAHRHHCGTQTDDLDRRDETNPLMSLECRLAAVDAKYALTFSQLRRLQAGADPTTVPFFTMGQIERRLEQHKADIREELRAEYQRKYRDFEQQKLQEARDSAAAQYRMMAAHKAEELREMERSLAVKSEMEKQRLAVLREDVERQRLALEKRQRDMTDAYHEHEKEVHEYEQRQRELQDKVRALHVTCTKWEELCATRLLEAEAARGREARRVDDLRQAQAEHAAELRLKEEEIARLRFKLRAFVQHPAGTAKSCDGKEEGDAPEPPMSEMDAELYQMLVRTEELQRNSLRQQQLMQEQQEGLQRQAEANTAHWSAAWSSAAAAAGAAPGAAPAASPAISTAAAAAAAAAPAPARNKPHVIEVMDETPVKAKTESVPKVVQPATTAETATAAAEVKKAQDVEKKESSPPPAAKDEATASATARALRASSSESAKSASKSSTGSAAAAPATLAPAPAPAAAATSPAPKSGSGSSARKTPSRSPPSASSSSPAAKPSPQSSPASSKSKSASSAASTPAKKSASSAATSAASSASKKSTPKAAAGEQTKAQGEARERVATEEGAQRSTVLEEEEDAFKAILWSEESKRAVIKEREGADAHSDSSTHSARGGILAQLAAQQQQQPQQQVDDGIIYRDSDDGDSILFGGSSGGSSF